MTSYTGSLLAFINADNSANTSVAFSGQTFPFGNLVPVKIASIVHSQIASAGTYELRLTPSGGSAILLATVVLGASTANVTFTPAAAVEVPPGVHVFNLDPTSHATRNLKFNNNQPAVLSGTGGQFAALGQMTEAGGSSVPCTINFQVEDSHVLAYASDTPVSAGNSTDEFATLTLTDAINFTGLRVRAITGSHTYTLSIDGTDVASYTKPGGGGAHDIALVPAAPVPLAAGARVFRIRRGTAGGWWYGAVSTPVTVAGTGAAYVSGWGLATNQATRRLLLHLGFNLQAPGVPTNLGETHDGDSIELTWDPPASGNAPTGYRVRLDGGAPTDVALLEVHDFTGLAVATNYDVEVQAYGPGGDSAWVGLNVTTDSGIVPPGVPENVAETHDLTNIYLTWDPPVTGDAVDHYEVRLDGFPHATTTDEFFTFDGLNMGDTYDVAVMAVNVGGASALVTLTVTTDTPDPDVLYRMVVDVGGHTFEVLHGDEAIAPTIALPLSLGWSIPEAVDFFPSQANPLSGSFGIAVESLDEVADIAKGDPVRLRLFAPYYADEPIVDTRTGLGLPDPDPYIDNLVVVELQALVGQPHSVLTVFVGEASILLRDKVIGFTVDWPEESILDRVDRIVEEAGLTFTLLAHNGWGVGILAARDGDRPIDLLSAIRTTLKDASDENDSDTPTIYSRPTYFYDPSTETVFASLAERRITSFVELDAGAVEVSARWSRSQLDRYTYVIVDTTIFGDDSAPGAIPYARSTSLVDVFPTNWSAFERDALGESLLPSGVPVEDRWRVDRIRHLSYANPEPIAGWLGSNDFYVPWMRLREVTIAGIEPTLTPDGSTEIVGLLASARLVIPPGGRFYVDVTLRPDSAPGAP